MIRRFAVALFMVSLWGCQYTAFEDLQCTRTSECPEGATCRSGYCAWDEVPEEDMPIDEGEDTVVRSIEVTPNLSLSVGGSSQMEAVARNAAGDLLSDLTFTWTSSNPDVATVDGGLVTALAAGTSTISASVSGVTGTARVDVNNPAVSIEISPATQEIGVNTEFQFLAVLRDINEDPLPGAITWESSDVSIMSVNQTGRVRGVSAGSATLTARFQALSATAEVDVVVLEPNVLEIEPATVQVPQGELMALTAKVFFREAASEVEIFDVPVVFSLDTVAFGSISSSEENGRAIAIFTANSTTQGTAILTATAGALEATAEIVVYRPEVSTITISPANPSRFVGEELTFTAQLRGTNNEVISRPVTWSVDVPATASIAASTGLVRTLAPGQVEVMATVDGKSATTTLTVAGFGASEVSTGADHTCAITSANYAFCWGKGADGRLGTGNNDRALIPIMVSGTRKYETISAANQHTCAISQGVGYCWGKGADGRLGRGNNSDSSTPVAVSGTQVFTKISAMSNHTCAVSNLDEIFCWGQGADGRLANNATTSESVPTKIQNPQGVVTIAWAMVSAGEQHTCALTTTNEAYCWGANGSGQIGDGTTDGRLIPTAVDMSALNGVTFSWIGAGKDFSCGRSSAGALYCWGSNESGRLGINSDDASRNTPTLVAGDHIFTTTSLGRDHICAATQVDAYCWGESDNGRLGGTDMDQKQPFMLPNAPAYIQMRAGGGHSCGIAPDFFLECFGKNNEGQIGINTQVDQLVPAGVWP